MEKPKMRIYGSHRRLDVDAVWRVREDGKWDITVFPEPAVMRMRGMLATVVVSRSDGKTEVHRPADPIAEWLPLHREPLVAKALRLRDQDSSLDWVELWRIYEVIEGDIGLSRMREFGWITGKKRKLFRRTANSVGAAGDAARHGHERTKPPPSPLPYREGRALADRILREWLKWKTAQLSSSP